MTLLRAAAGVLARGDDILICQRRPSDRHPGKWEFPGGKIEAGESAPACVARELREELGIHVVPGREVWRTQHRYPDLRVELVFILVESFRGELRNLCFAEMRWVCRAELATYDLLEADREFVARVDRGEIAL